MKLPRLREVRERHGWSQRRLSEEAGVSRDSISNYETGQRDAWPSTAGRLAEALGVEISDLMGVTSHPKGQSPPPKLDEGERRFSADAEVLETRRPDEEEVKGYLRSIGAELSALSGEDFSQELVNRALKESGLTRLVTELRKEVEIASMEWDADRQNQLKRAALRRARNGRYVTAIAFRSVRKYAIGAFPEEEKKIAELAKLAKELEREGREREMAGAA